MGKLNENSTVGGHLIRHEGEKITKDDLDASLISEIDDKGSFSGDYNDLTNKPAIPTKASDVKALPLGIDGTAIVVTNGDWDNVIDTGFYNGDSNLNSPLAVGNENNWWHVIVSKHSFDPRWVLQIATNFSSGRQLKRVKNGAVWQPWKPVGEIEIDNDPADITYYVRTNGNDSNNGQSEATAFKTFGKAMTMWKTITTGGKRTFDIGSGVDLTPDLTPTRREWKVSNKFGGQFEFNFNNAHGLVPQFTRVWSRVTLKNFTRTNTAINDGFGIGEYCTFDDCLFVDVDNVKVDFSKLSPEGYAPNVWAFSFYNTNGRVGSAQFTKVNNGFSASGCNLFLYNPTGTTADTYGTPINATNGAIVDTLAFAITGSAKKYETRYGGQVFGIA